MKVAAFPRDPNPYQDALHTALGDLGVDVEFVPFRTPSQTANLMLLPAELLLLRIRGVRLLHVHWVYPFAVAWGADRGWAQRAARCWLGIVLSSARLLGVRLLWTAHNLLPHHRVFADDLEARRRLVSACSAVIVHSDEAGAGLREMGCLPSSLTTIPHGRPAVAATAAESRSQPAMRTREPVRSRLGAKPLDRVVALVGRIERYKGPAELLTAVRGLDREGTLPSALHVLIAGECRDSLLREELEALAQGLPQVHLWLEYLSDEDLEALLAAVDIIVLPFQRITTSGSAVSALSVGLPLMLPAGHLLADLPAAAIHRYEDLGDALRWAAAVPAPQLARMSDGAVAWAGTWSWADAALATRQVYAAVHDRRARRDRLAAALRRILSDNLFRDSVALMANSVVGSVLGFGFWAVAARSVPVADVGVVGASLSACVLMSTISVLGLPNALVRYLPSSGAESRRLCSAATLVTVIFAGLVLGATWWTPLRMPLAKTGGWAAGWCALVLMLTAVGMVVDAALVSTRRAYVVLVKNGIGGLVRILLLTLPSAPVHPALRLAAAHILGTAVSTVMALVWLDRRGLRGPLSPSLAGLRTLWRFSAANYVGMIIGILPATVTPLIVIHRLGSTDAGYYGIVLMMLGMLTFIPSAIAQSLFAEASRTGHLTSEFRRALRGVYALLVPAVLGTCLLAPWLFLPFGLAYVDPGTDLLRWVALGTIPSALSYLLDAHVNSRGDARGYLVLNAQNSLFVLTFVAIGAGSGLTGAGLGWCLGQALSAAVSVAYVMLTIRPAARTATPGGNPAAAALQAWHPVQSLAPAIVPQQTTSVL